MDPFNSGNYSSNDDEIVRHISEQEFDVFREARRARAAEAAERRAKARLSEVSKTVPALDDRKAFPTLAYAMKMARTERGQSPGSTAKTGTSGMRGGVRSKKSFRKTARAAASTIRAGTVATTPASTPSSTAAGGADRTAPRTLVSPLGLKDKQRRVEVWVVSDDDQENVGDIRSPLLTRRQDQSRPHPESIDSSSDDVAGDADYSAEEHVQEPRLLRGPLFDPSVNISPQGKGKAPAHVHHTGGETAMDDEEIPSPRVRRSAVFAAAAVTATARRPCAYTTQKEAQSLGGPGGVLYLLNIPVRARVIELGPDEAERCLTPDQLDSLRQTVQTWVRVRERAIGRQPAVDELLSLPELEDDEQIHNLVMSYCRSRLFSDEENRVSLDTVQQDGYNFSRLLIYLHCRWVSVLSEFNRNHANNGRGGARSIDGPATALRQRWNDAFAVARRILGRSERLEPRQRPHFHKGATPWLPMDVRRVMELIPVEYPRRDVMRFLIGISHFTGVRGITALDVDWSDVLDFRIRGDGSWSLRLRFKRTKGNQVWNQPIWLNGDGANRSLIVGTDVNGQSRGMEMEDAAVHETMTINAARERLADDRAAILDMMLSSFLRLLSRTGIMEHMPEHVDDIGVWFEQQGNTPRAWSIVSDLLARHAARENIGGFQPTEAGLGQYHSQISLVTHHAGYIGAQRLTAHGLRGGFICSVFLTSYLWGKDIVSVMKLAQIVGGWGAEQTMMLYVKDMTRELVNVERLALPLDDRSVNLDRLTVEGFHGFAGPPLNMWNTDKARGFVISNELASLIESEIAVDMPEMMDEDVELSVEDASRRSAMIQDVRDGVYRAWYQEQGGHGAEGGAMGVKKLFSGLLAAESERREDTMRETLNDFYARLTRERLGPFVRGVYEFVSDRGALVYRASPRNLARGRQPQGSRFATKEKFSADEKHTLYLVMTYAGGLRLEDDDWPKKLRNDFPSWVVISNVMNRMMRDEFGTHDAMARSADSLRSHLMSVARAMTGTVGGASRNSLWSLNLGQYGERLKSFNGGELSASTKTKVVMSRFCWQIARQTQLDSNGMVVDFDEAVVKKMIAEERVLEMQERTEALSRRRAAKIRPARINEDSDKDVDGMFDDDDDDDGVLFPAEEMTPKKKTSRRRRLMLQETDDDDGHTGPLKRGALQRYKKRRKE